MATRTLDQELDAFFGADPDTIAWPYPLYARWQQGSGVVRWESGPAWVVTRHRDVKAVMAGQYPIRNNAYRYGRMAEAVVDRLPEEGRVPFFRVLDFESHFMSRHDGESHARLRRIASRAFTAKSIEKLRASIQGHVDDLLAEMTADGGPVDVKRDLADKLPTRVIADLLGVPQSDRDMIWHWSEAIAGVFSVNMATLQAADDAIGDFRQYVGAMVERVRTTGEGPELARVLLDRRADDAMTEDELVAMYLLLLFGGSETTTNLLGNGFLGLQRHRDQWDLLVSDPSLVRGAVEELMRYDSPHHYLPRYAAEDFELGGHQIRANDTVIIVMGAANRDPEVFEDPERLDILRPNKGEQLSLAYGAHFCLGAALARLEGEIVFTSLVQRYPRARLLRDDSPYRGSAMLRAIVSLPTELAA